MEQSNLPLHEGYTLEQVWGAKAPAIQEDLVDFWLRSGALPTRELALARVEQVSYLARENSSQQIVAVSSVYRQHNAQLGHPFYYFRCFVDERHRRVGLALTLLVHVRDELNARFVAGEDPEILGIMIEVQNAALSQEHTAAVWPRSGFVYIGRNQRGDQVRVYYFTGARIA